MNDAPQASPDFRRDIAARDRRRALQSQDYNLMLLTIGILAYSAFGYLMTFAGVLLRGGLLDALVNGVFGGLYVFAVYRVWARDDRRWWVVALPAGLSLLLILVCWAAGLGFAAIPLALNLALLVLMVLRVRVGRQLQEVAPAPARTDDMPAEALAGPGPAAAPAHAGHAVEETAAVQDAADSSHDPHGRARNP